MLMKFVFTIVILTVLIQACNAQSNEKSKTEERPPVISVIQCAKNTENTEAVKLCNSGLDFNIKREYNRAIADFTKAIELDPKYAEAYHRRGVAYSNKKEANLAIADFTKAIELTPKSDVAYLNRGGLYLIKEDYELAIADFTELIELDPKTEVNYLIRAQAYDKIGRKDLAVADRQTAKELRNAPK